MRLRTHILPLVVLALFAGCVERDELDLVPPVVIAVEPKVTLVPITVDFRLRFSEPLNPKTVFREDKGSTVIIVERSVVTKAFLTDFNNPPLIESRLQHLVPVEIALEAGDTEITVQPTARLKPGTAYSLLVSADVRDTSGNPLFGAGGSTEAFRFDFTTDDGPPQLLSDDLGSGVVVPNRKYFRVTFNQGVVGLSRETVRIEPADAIAETLVPVAEALLISEDRSVATLVLADNDGCERLAAGGAYDLVIGPGIADDEGETMELIRLPFATGASCDLTPNALREAPLALPTDVSATIQFVTTKPSTTEVRFGLAGGPLDCLGAHPCPVVGPYGSTTAAGSPGFLHSAVLEGLVVGETYAFRVRAEDETGSTAIGQGQFVTAPLPQVSINEIMGNPPNVDGIPSDNAGEYIELLNFGEEDVDLSGWSITIGGTSDSTCKLSENVTLAPGQYLLLVPGDFPHAYYGTDPTRATTTVGGTRLCGGIANSNPVPVTLSDAEGRPVSSFGGHLKHDKDGRSVERVAPDAPDVAESFCYSRNGDGPTPLAPNGVALRGCD